MNIPLQSFLRLLQLGSLASPPDGDCFFTTLSRWLSLQRKVSIPVPQLRAILSQFLLSDPEGQSYVAYYKVPEVEIKAQRPGRFPDIGDNHYASEVTFQAAAHVFRLQINCLIPRTNATRSFLGALIFRPPDFRPSQLPPPLHSPQIFTFTLVHKHVDGVFPLSVLSSLPSFHLAPHLASLPDMPHLRLSNFLTQINQRSTKKTKTKSTLTSRLPGLSFPSPVPPRCSCPLSSPCLPQTCTNCIHSTFCPSSCPSGCLNSYHHFKPLSLLQTSRPDGSIDILASTGISKGTIIHQFTGAVTPLALSSAILPPLNPSSRPYLRRCGPFLINAYEYGNVTRFIRNSRTPNIDLLPRVIDSARSLPLSGLFLIATSDIPAFTPLYLPIIDMSTPPHSSYDDPRSLVPPKRSRSPSPSSSQSPAPKDSLSNPSKKQKKSSPPAPSANNSQPKAKAKRSQRAPAHRLLFP